MWRLCPLVREYGGPTLQDRIHSAPLSRDARYAIWQRQLNAAGVSGDTAAQVELIRRQVQRACSPLPALAVEQATDPIPLAAGQAAEGLQVLNAP